LHPAGPVTSNIIPSLGIVAMVVLPGSLFDSKCRTMSGIVWKEQYLIICFETPFKNCSICLQIYCRKALLAHLPISIMVYTGTPARYISIAAPDHREYVPISCGSMPTLPLPTAAHAAQSTANTSNTFQSVVVPNRTDWCVRGSTPDPVY
jgi:hypothetical protein